MSFVKLFTGSAKVKHIHSAQSYTAPSVRHGSNHGVRTRDNDAVRAGEKRRLAQQISTNLTRFDKSAPDPMTPAEINAMNKKYWN